MHNKIKIISIVLILVVFVIIIYTQIYKPVNIQAKKVECSAWDATYVSIEAQAKACQSGEYDKSKIFIHSFNGKLPSDNPNDYMTVYCKVGINNRSIFNMKSVEAIVLELGDYKENVLFSYSSGVAVSGNVFRFSKSDITFILDLYTGNMDENAIRKMVKGIKARVITEGDFIGIREETLDFSKCKDVTVEFAK